MQVYLDYNGSAPLAAEVEQYLINRLQEKRTLRKSKCKPFSWYEMQYGVEKSRNSIAKAFSVKSEKYFLTLVQLRD